MCRCEGYGFEALYSGTGYINHWESLGLENGIIFQETDQLVEGFSLNKGNRELPLKNMKKIKIGKFNFTQLSLKATLG